MQGVNDSNRNGIVILSLAPPVDKQPYITAPDELIKASNFVLSILNKLGGDYTVIDTLAYEVVLANQSHCPGLLCQRKQNKVKKCIELRKALNSSLKASDSDLTVDFTECVNDNDSHCVYRINLC